VDDRTKTKPQDSARISLHQKYEVSYWTEKFDCTPERLKAAIAKVGPVAKAVEQELKRNKVYNRL
jgi:hypothetical protein